MALAEIRQLRAAVLSEIVDGRLEIRTRLGNLWKERKIRRL